jgi:hypothetical protein
MGPTALVPIELGGKSRNLRYTNRSMVRIEEELAKPGNGTFRQASVMVWAGLLHERPALSLDQVIDLIDPAELETIGKAVDRAMKLAIGKQEEQDEGNALAAD